MKLSPRLGIIQALKNRRTFSVCEVDGRVKERMALANEQN